MPGFDSPKVHHQQQKSEGGIMLSAMIIAIAIIWAAYIISKTPMDWR